MDILGILVIVIIFLISVMDIIIYILTDIRITKIERRLNDHWKVIKLLILESNQRDLEKYKKNKEEK